MALCRCQNICRWDCLPNLPSNQLTLVHMGQWCLDSRSKPALFTTACNHCNQIAQCLCAESKLVMSHLLTSPACQFLFNIPVGIKARCMGFAWQVCRQRNTHIQCSMSHEKCLCCFHHITDVRMQNQAGAHKKSRKLTTQFQRSGSFSLCSWQVATIEWVRLQFEMTSSEPRRKLNTWFHPSSSSVCANNEKTLQFCTLLTAASALDFLIAFQPGHLLLLDSWTNKSMMTAEVTPTWTPFETLVTAPAAAWTKEQLFHQLLLPCWELRLLCPGAARRTTERSTMWGPLTLGTPFASSCTTCFYCCYLCWQCCYDYGCNNNCLDLDIIQFSPLHVENGQWHVSKLNKLVAQRLRRIIYEKVGIGAPLVMTVLEHIFLEVLTGAFGSNAHVHDWIDDLKITT